MARIRSLKPEFWHDRKLARQTSRDARMLYMGLWNHADEHARANGDLAVVKGQVFPYDEIDIEPLLEELSDAGVVVRYEVDGDPFLYLPKLAKHQRLEPSKVASRFPAPEDADESARGADFLRDDQALAADMAPDLHTQIFPDESEKTCAESGKKSALHVSGVMDQVTSEKPPRLDVEQLCSRLADWTVKNGSKPPTAKDRWRREARLLLDRDGRPLEEALALIDWSQRHHFWHTVILSMDNFRKKYDQLRLQAAAMDQPTPPPVRQKVIGAFER